MFNLYKKCNFVTKFIFLTLSILTGYIFNCISITVFLIILNISADFNAFKLIKCIKFLSYFFFLIIFMIIIYKNDIATLINNLLIIILLITSSNVYINNVSVKENIQLIALIQGLLKFNIIKVVKVIELTIIFIPLTTRKAKFFISNIRLNSTLLKLYWWNRQIRYISLLVNFLFVDMIKNTKPLSHNLYMKCYDLKEVTKPKVACKVCDFVVIGLIFLGGFIYAIFN